jgi:hypothetical protein
MPAGLWLSVLDHGGAARARATSFVGVIVVAALLIIALAGSREADAGHESTALALSIRAEEVRQATPGGTLVTSQLRVTRSTKSARSLPIVSSLAPPWTRSSRSRR